MIGPILRVLSGLGAAATAVGETVRAVGSFVAKGAPPLSESRAKLAESKRKRHLEYEALKRDALGELPDEQTPAETPRARRSRPPGEP